ncbi:hypothetical protein C8R45DRAFT_940930 [Mycena sanguinolenta]|nr:hypothetical protein C8R45DRAFT_940930 [Mycena sanguinolenta]
MIARWAASGASLLKPPTRCLGPERIRGNFAGFKLETAVPESCRTCCSVRSGFIQSWARTLPEQSPTETVGALVLPVVLVVVLDAVIAGLLVASSHIASSV